MTSFLQKTRLFIREETPYCYILSGIILFHAFSSLSVSFKPLPSTHQVSESRLAKAEQTLSADPQKLQKLLEKYPDLQLLGGLLSLLLVVVLFLGFFLIFQFWTKRRNGEWEYPWRLLSPPPAWGLRDVFRVTILLVLIAYLVEIVQGLLLLFWKLDLPEETRLMVNTTFLDLVALGLVLYWISVRKNQSLRGLGFSIKHFGRHLFFGLSSYAALLPLLGAALLSPYGSPTSSGWKLPSSRFTISSLGTPIRDC